MSTQLQHHRQQTTLVLRLHPEEICLHEPPCPAGKWQGALVAIKVVEHRLRRSLEELDEARESLLSASVSHPNVVRSSGQRPPSQHRNKYVLPCTPWSFSQWRRRLCIPTLWL